MKLAYPPAYNFLFKNGDEKEAMNLNRSLVNCLLLDVCINWAMYQKNVLILMPDIYAESLQAYGDLVGENSEPLLFRLEDGVFFNTGQIMIMFHGDPLLRRGNEIIDRVVEAGLYNYWISLIMNHFKLKSQKIAIAYPLAGYYSFNLKHMQPAFYFLLMGFCLSVFCFEIEVLCNRVLSKRK
jgi:hypothetical protein